MLERVKLFAIHATAHVFFYWVPRGLFTLFVRVPVSLFELITFRRRLTFSFRREREIVVVAAANGKEAFGIQTQRVCGLLKPALYRAPLYNPHLNTVLAAMRVPHRIDYDRELLEAEDGNPICLDWLRVPVGGLVKPKAVLLVVPGMGNYGQTPYMQRVVRAAVKRGFHVCVLTPRGMGSAPLTVPQLTCVTFTADLRTVLRQRFATTAAAELPLYVLGYSAGGMTVLKGLAEEMSDAAVLETFYPNGFPAKLCVTVCPPYDMVDHARSMLSPIGLALYQPAMMSALRKYTQKHWGVLKHGIPGLPPRTEAEMRAAAARLKTVEDFEEHLLAPHFGYTGRLGYYADAYAPQWIRKIPSTLTVVCFAARDDPVVGHGVTREEWQAIADEHTNVAYVETSAGGHLAYMLSPFDEFMEKPCYLTTGALDVCDSFYKNMSALVA